MNLRAHTRTLINWIPISALVLGVLTAYVWLRAPQAKPLLSVIIWLVAGGYALFWLMRDRRDTGYARSRWLSFAAVLPVLQLLPLGYYLVRTRGLRAGLRSTVALLVFAAVVLVAFGGGITMGSRIFT